MNKNIFKPRCKYCGGRSKNPNLFYFCSVKCSSSWSQWFLNTFGFWLDCAKFCEDYFTARDRQSPNLPEIEAKLRTAAARILQTTDASLDPAVPQQERDGRIGMLPLNEIMRGLLTEKKRRMKELVSRRKKEEIREQARFRKKQEVEEDMIRGGDR